MNRQPTPGEALLLTEARHNIETFNSETVVEGDFLAVGDGAWLADLQQRDRDRAVLVGRDEAAGVWTWIIVQRTLQDDPEYLAATVDKRLTYMLDKARTVGAA